jgi:hypothetical protein
MAAAISVSIKVISGVYYRCEKLLPVQADLLGQAQQSADIDVGPDRRETVDYRQAQT